MRRLALLGSCALALLLPAGAQAASVVEGTVRPLQWAPEVEVCVVESRPSETCTVPAADGSYALDKVPFGGVKIEFVPSYRSGLLGQYYNGVARLSEAATIVLTPESLPAKDIDATLAEGGRIEGTVTAAAGGEPLPEVEACAISVGSPTVKSCDETDAGGRYELHSLPTETYRVGFRGTGKSAEYEPWYHQPVGVTAGGVTAGIDAALAEGAQIRGVVTAAAGGAPLAGITVCLFAAAEPGPRRCTYSDAAGGYSFVGLPTGSYQVGFSPGPAEIGGGEDGFESQYYDGVAGRAEATTLSPIAPAVLEGVDAALAALPTPPVPAPAPILTTPIVPAPPPVAGPGRPRVRCGKGRRRKQTKKGKVRCVRAVRHKAHRRHERRAARHGHGGGRR